MLNVCNCRNEFSIKNSEMDKNPHNLKKGDFILIKYVEGGGLPKKFDNKWFPIVNVTKGGIPRFHNRVFRRVRPENVGLIRRKEKEREQIIKYL